MCAGMDMISVKFRPERDCKGHNELEIIVRTISSTHAFYTYKKFLLKKIRGTWDSFFFSRFTRLVYVCFQQTFITCLCTYAFYIHGCVVRFTECEMNRMHIVTRHRNVGLRCLWYVFWWYQMKLWATHVRSCVLHIPYVYHNTVKWNNKKTILFSILALIFFFTRLMQVANVKSFWWFCTGTN